VADFNTPNLSVEIMPSAFREGEMGISVRVQQNDAQAVTAVWGNYHRKDFGPLFCQIPEDIWPSGIGELRHVSGIWFHLRWDTGIDNAVAKLPNRTRGT
jgi:hypothetical protein